MVVDKSNKGIVQFYLGIYRYYGLYEADIIYRDTSHKVIEKVDVTLHRLDEVTYVQAMQSLNDLSDIGLTPVRQQAAEKTEKEFEKNLKRAEEQEIKHPWKGHMQ